MLLPEIQEVVSVPFEAVNQTIKRQLSSDVPLIGHLGNYIIESGGKRIRPLLHLLCAHALGYKGQSHIQVAAIIEFIHTATLLHDDVVDDSTQRRGQPTANTVWGNPASVLVGDFLYSRAFQMMVQVNQMSVLGILSDATNMIAEGEVMQLMHRHNAQLDTDTYFHVIHCKTAKLFEAAAALAAVVSECPDASEPLRTYGFNIGMAFQLIDDILDYQADPKTLGKNVGDDLQEGKMTLPLIYAMSDASPSVRADLEAIITQPSSEPHVFETVVKAIQESNAIAQCQEVAQMHVEAAKNALQKLPENTYRTALSALADCAVARVH